MALLGMGANVQYHGYFPGYCSTKDLIFDSEGSMWTSSNINSELKNDCHNIGSLPVSSSNINKELLKQTILKQEAVFRDQIHELHRVYHRQRDLMDGIKRNELYKHSLRLEASWSNSSLSSKNAQKICFTPNLPRSTGQSPALIAERIQLPLASSPEKSRQMCPAPTVTEESLKDSKESMYRKVGKKILDLQLPADEYIDSEEGKCLENGRVTGVHQVSGYSFNRTSLVVCDSNDKPHGTKSHDFADLNVPCNLKVDAAVKSYGLEGLAHHRNNPFYYMSRRTTSGSQNFPNDVIQNLNKRQDLEAFSTNLQPDPVKKHEWLSYGNTSGRKFSRSESSAQTQDSTSNGLLGPSSASRTCSPFDIVSEADMITSGFSPAELWKTPVFDFGPRSIAVQELPCFSYSASLDQSSKPLISISGFSQNELYQCISAKSDPILDNRKFLDPNKFLNSGSSDSHELAKYVKGSDNVGTSRNLNLNITPGGYSDTTASQSIQITGEENELQDSTRGLSWLKEKPVFKGKSHVSSDLQCFEVFQNQTKNRSTEEIERGCISDVTSPQIHVQNKHESVAGLIDLNSCMIEEENMPVDVDFKAAVSPESKECSPPRGECDENQLEMLVQLAEQEDPEVQEDQIRIAAESLVSISGLVAHNSLQMTMCSSSESFVSSPLPWFADIVSATVNHPMEDFSNKVNDLEEFMLAGMDYFEFTTLNLTETKVSDCCCKSGGQTEQVSGSTSPTQLKKGRTNRGRWRKDFQKEILPSLASLSWYEVTEDLQTIGGLVASGTTNSETGSLRSTGKNALARGRKRSCASTSNNTNSTELSIEKRGLISWGKTCKKRRGQRVPTTNPKFILRSI
ncbi:PREDICTED: uncharacterized protein LOC109344364 isoform X2 [Lupinus angustifolius]|uniref:uncharacterized protein LOC109344364 isoform X2 n=1 Tax=Lupinus angustifolius TaxID=3871 RepID=UPI00092F41D9|nr:PREDICTED: uncharacterized protein LOC109344364 isoform X2 [Lupinus angustifolius]